MTNSIWYNWDSLQYADMIDKGESRHDEHDNYVNMIYWLADSEQMNPEPIEEI